MVGGEELFPGGISSREKTLNRGRAKHVLVGSIGSRVGKLRELPVGEGGGRDSGVEAIEEVVGNVANATKGVNSEGEQLDVLGVEEGDDVKAGGVRSIAMKFCLCFLVVPVMGRIHSVWDM